MTYRLCVIGNSHIAALKLGWDQLMSHDHAVTKAIAPTYFGAPRDGLKNIEIRDGRLVPTKAEIREQFLRMSDGRAEIDPAAYDGFLLVGLGVSMKRVLRLYRTHRWFGLQQEPGHVVTSQGFAQAFLTEGYAGTRLVTVARMLAELGARHVFATPEPYWSALMPNHIAKRGDFGWAKAAGSGDGDPLADVFAASVSAAMSHHMTMIWQPPATIEHGIMTRSMFNKGASKFISGQGEESDAAHMNADYGAVWWAAALDRFVPADAGIKPRRAASKRSA
jgi:hypothetical protein